MAARNEGEIFARVCDSFERAKASKLEKKDVLKCLKLLAEESGCQPTSESTGKPEKRHAYFLIGYAFQTLLWIVYRLAPFTILITSLFYPLYQLYHTDPCLYPQLLPVAEFAMPIISCDICQGFTRAPEISSNNITVEQFMEEYAYTSQPVLIKGAASSWPALTMFSYEYFRELYLKRPQAVEEDNLNGQFFAYSSGIHNLEEFLGLSNDSSSKKWYIGWSSNDEYIGNELRKHLKEPSFLPPEQSDRNIAWIFMGSPGPGASLHIDFVGETSWQAQLSGTKTWTLVPPPECEHLCQSLNVTVNQGDIFVVDTNVWFHATHIHNGNMSITFGTEFE